MEGYRRVLRNGAFFRLLVGETISSVGDWLYLVAILVVVYQVTQDPLVLGIVGAVRLVPFVVLSVPAGIIADRFDRRLVLLVTDVARGALMVVLAFLVATDAPVAAIVGIAVAAASFSAFFGPAIGAYLPALVANERDLGPANALWATLDNLAYFIGPAIAGLLIAAGGLELAFLLNAASFAVVAVVLVTLPSSRGGSTDSAEEGEPDAAKGPTRLSLARLVAGPLLVDAATSFANTALGVLVVLVAIDQLAAGEQAVGYLQAATGIGGICAGFVAGALVARRLDLPLIGGALVGTLSLGALALATNLPVALVAIGVGVGALLLLDIVVTTVLQRRVPNANLGQAMGLLQLSGVIAALAGSLVAPALVPVLGLGTVLAGVGAAQLVAAVAAVIILARQGALDARPPIEAARAELLRRATLALAPPARLEVAVRALVERPVTVDEIVIREGDVADLFYVVAEGRFGVSQAAPDGGRTTLRELGPGDGFGEIGILTGSPRTATVAALSDGLLLALDREAFMDLVGPGADLRTGMLARYLPVADN